MIVVFTWAPMRRLERRMGGRRGPAATVMTLAMLLVFVLPLAVAVGAIFAGVIGGLLSFGLLGLFVGPVVLAVTYTLVNAWVKGSAPATAGSESSVVDRDRALREVMEKQT